ncbi:MAG: hypothetical protein ACYDBZ_16030 [Steroidobacteraceae bacterium]
MRPGPVVANVPPSVFTLRWLSLASDGWGMERAMGIEPTVKALASL